METKSSFTLSQRIKASTTVFAVMLVANAALLLFFSIRGEAIAFSTAVGVPVLGGLTLGGLFALIMDKAGARIQIIFWFLTSIFSALAFAVVTKMIFF